MTQPAPIGILMLDTRFPRLPGDIGNPATFGFPVRYRIVAGALAPRVVFGSRDALLPPFLDAARALVAEGARGIATSCGFLALLQRELAGALPVPVATSALLQAATIEAMLPPGRAVGVLTFAAEALTPAHLLAAGARPDLPVGGFAAGSAFRRLYGGELDAVDPAVLEAEAVAAAQELVAAHPHVGAILCECTNLPPHAAAIAAATGRAVFDVAGFIDWFARGLAPRRFDR